MSSKRSRRAKRDPDCLALCYIRLKKSAAEILAQDDSIARLAGTNIKGKETNPDAATSAHVPYWVKKNAEAASSVGGTDSAAAKAAADAAADARYRFAFLEGKYMCVDPIPTGPDAVCRS